MKIREVNIKKFLSLENVTYQLPETGTILVDGINKITNGSNGSGKTALFEAIYWAIYGKTLRGSTDANANVSIIVEKGNNVYLINRTKSSLYLEENGVQQKDLKTNIQSYIETFVVGFSYKLFQTLIYLNPYTLTKWFIEFDDTDRKKLFVESLGLESLTALTEKVKADKRSAEELYNKTKLDYFSTQSALNEINRILEPYNEMYKSFNDKLSFMKDLLKEDIQPTDFDKYLSVIETQISQSMQQLAVKEYRRRELESKIREINTKTHNLSVLTSCPVCLQDIPDSHKDNVKKSLEEESKNYSEEIKLLTEEIYKIQSELSGYQGIKSEFSELIEVYKKLASISNETKRHAELSDKINSLINVLKQEESKVEELKLWEKVFSPTGLISRVIDHVIEAVGEYMSLYTELMGFGEVTTVIDNRGKINYSVDYKSLSSGERRRVEIALMFALRQVIPCPFPVLVIDEIFDHLDQVGLEATNLVIEHFLQTNPILISIISHRGDIPIEYDYRWTIIKEKTGVSRLSN